MSKLQDLIAELCPDGVEYKELQDIAEFRRGSFPQPYGESRWYGGENAMPFVQVADVGEDLKLVNTTKQMISKLAQPKSVFVPIGTVIVTLQGSIGRVAITQYDSYVDRTLAIFESFKIIIDKKYFAYLLRIKFEIEKKFARGSTLKTITKEEFRKFKIPIPPLPIQEEIVRILDTFNEVQTELINQLQAELTARKQQYEYCKDSLLTFGDDVERKTLGDIAKFKYGYTDKAKNIGDTRFIRITDINDSGKLKFGDDKFVNLDKSNDEYLLQAEDLIVARTGATFGKTLLFNENFRACYASFLIKISFKDIDVLPQYYWHFSKSNYYWSQAMILVSSGGGQPQFNANALNKIILPVPPLPEQERIVTILDNLDNQITEITQKLSEEISARKQQYEYYRDTLLTFKEI